MDGPTMIGVQSKYVTHTIKTVVFFVNWRILSFYLSLGYYHPLYACGLLS